VLFWCLVSRYLDHIISATGVAMDPAKVQAIHDWPAPRSVRAVRGFLGLAGYYCKFVHNYDTVAAPLTALLKKDGSALDEAIAAAFSGLKAAVTSDPILTMLDFAKFFVVECDASTFGFGAMLVQEGHLVAYFRHAQATDPALVAIHDEFRTAPWTITDGMVALEGSLYIPAACPLL
jgi:hypothetical protein